MGTKRILAGALAAGMLLSGCRATGELAHEWRDLVSVGMTQEDVFDELGCPSLIRVETGPPLEDHWTYRVIADNETPLRHAGTVLAVAVVAVLVVAAVKGGGGGLGGLGGGGGGGGGGTAETVWEFTVTFDVSGRVTRISEIRRIR